MPESLPIWLQVVGVAGVVLGGLGAAVGGIAAWRAASESAATGKNALDALALGIKPSVTDELTCEYGDDAGEGRPSVVISNTSEWDALDVEVEVMRRDGRRVKASTQRLAAERTAQDSDEDLDVDLGGLDPSVPEEWRDSLELLVRLVRVRFSDYRSIARYEWTHFYDFEANEDDESVGMSGEEWEDEKRIQ